MASSLGKRHPRESVIFRWYLGFFAAYILLGAVIIARRLGSNPVLPVTYLLVLAALGVLLIRARRMGEREVVRANYRLCLQCRYELPRGVQQGTCPECGEEFTLDELVVGWRSTYPRLIRTVAKS